MAGQTPIIRRINAPKPGPAPANGTPARKVVTPPARKAPPRAVNLPTGERAPKITSLPDSDEPAITRLEQATVNFHGQRKIGKTLTAMEFPGAFLLMFEPGGAGFTGRKQRIMDWYQFEDVVDLLLQRDPAEYARLCVIDTAAKAYDYAWAMICQRHGVTHPNDAKDFGKTWDRIREEFAKQMDRIRNSGRGLLFISHTEIQEQVGHEGGTIQKFMPAMKKHAFTYCTGEADVTLYLGYFGKERYMVLEGAEDLEAGTRLKKRFWVKGKEGIERVYAIPMGKNEGEAYRNLLRAFNNEQAERCEPRYNAVLSNIRAPRKREG